MCIILIENVKVFAKSFTKGTEQKQSLYTDAVLPYVNIHTTTEKNILYLFHSSNNYIMLFKNGLEQLPKCYHESNFFWKYSDIIFKINEKENIFKRHKH